MERVPRSKDIGDVSGKLLAFGGVYGNLQALQALQQVAISAAISPANIFCSGDVAGYCAQPVACIELINRWGIHTIAGNVEIQLREDADNCGCDFSEGSRCDLLSHNWYAFTKQAIGETEIQWMHGLPDTIRFAYAGRRCVLLHGSFSETAGYIFKSTPWSEKKANLQAANADLIISGHSGLPFIQSRDGLSWLNSGAAGMPANDGSPCVWYLIIEQDDSGSISASQLPLDYDYALTASFMKAAGLPEQYVATLSSGLWDNCEILPEAETRAQGRRIMPASQVILPLSSQ